MPHEPFDELGVSSLPLWRRFEQGLTLMDLKTQGMRRKAES
jgi:hypothetical protein